MTDTTTQAALRLIELAKAADQDKREVLDGRRVSVNRPPPFAGGGWSSVCLAMTHEGHGLKAEANAAFIAACDPQTITAICQALQSLTAERDELRAQVEALRSSIKPISVKDRLPPKNVEVFVFFAGQCQTLWTTGQYTGSQYDKHGWCYPAENNGSTHDGGDPVVTHWLPMEVLPSPDNARKEGD